jgi:hypothetical protein
MLIWWIWSCLWNENWQRKPKFSENLPQNYVVQQNSHITWHRIEPVPRGGKLANNRLGTFIYTVSWELYLELWLRQFLVPHQIAGSTNITKKVFSPKIQHQVISFSGYTQGRTPHKQKKNATKKTGLAGCCECCYVWQVSRNFRNRLI